MDGCQAWAGAWPAHEEGQVSWCEGWLRGWPANKDGQVSGCVEKNGRAACIRRWPGVGVWHEGWADGACGPASERGQVASGWVRGWASGQARGWARGWASGSASMGQLCPTCWNRWCRSWCRMTMGAPPLRELLMNGNVMYGLSMLALMARRARWITTYQCNFSQIRR